MPLKIRSSALQHIEICETQKNDSFTIQPTFYFVVYFKMKLFFKTQKKKSIPKVKSDSLIDVDGGTGLKQLHQRK